MGTSGAAEHVFVETIASSSCEANGAAEQRCVDANSEYETNAMRMLDSRIALAMACSATGPQNPSSGAISKEIEARKMYDEALRNLRMTQQLLAQLNASKGQGKGNIKAERLRSWWDMSASEQWWLEQFWTGRLHKRLAKAKQKQITLAQADRITLQRFQ